MPPIPNAFDEETNVLIKLLGRSQKDLLEYQIPRLRSCKGPLATQQQYAAEIREDIEAFARQLETLDVAVDDQRGERNRRALKQIVEEFQTSLARLRKESRAALLTSKRAIDTNALSNREELLRSSAVQQKQDLSEKVAEDALMTASNNVTEALQRTLTLMQGELEKSVLSSQLLDASTATLKSTSSTHDTLDNLLQTSRHIITALEKSDWLDRLLILAALAFFILVVLFILQQRIVNRGLRVAFWWTRFIPLTSNERTQGAGAVDIMEKGSASVVESVVTSVITVVSSVVSSAVVSASVAALSTSQPSAEPPSSVIELFSTSVQPTPSPIDSTLPTAETDLELDISVTDTLLPVSLSPSSSAHDEL